jgi:ABC-2 type transport system ATP-binding protein
MDAIATRRLTRRFDALTAVDALDLAVAEGEIFGLVGPDGAGKTTTLRMLASILTPTSGEARVAGFDVAREPDAVKERVGYMSQRFGLYADLTVAENIRFYADIYGVTRREQSERLDRLMAFSGLGHFVSRAAGDLSGGMKQKLALMCALIHRPRILLLDEPTNGVDPVSRRDFWRILYQLLRERVTVLFATAYLDEAERCARVGLLSGGRMLALGAPDELKRLLRGTVLEARCAAPRRAAEALRARLPALRPGLFGDRVHLLSTDPARDEPAVREALRGGDVPLDSLRAVDPSLEDVFISLVTAPPEARP